MDLLCAVALAKKGNNEGITYLYEKTYQKSYYIALKYLKNEHLAQDVLQDSYIKAFQSLGQLDDASKFEAWLGRIVTTRSLNELKKKNPVLFSETETEDEGDISDSFEDDRVDTCPELAIDQKETTRLIREMMASLSDEQRICITMFYMEEMSVKEIAETLGVSENTVKSRLNYGRSKIKNKVLELEKKGTKLYGLLPMVFFLSLFKKDAMACEVAVPSASIALSGVGVTQGGAIGTTSAATAKAGLTIGGITVSAKTAIIAVATAVVLAGGVGIYANTRPEVDEATEFAAVEQENNDNSVDEFVEVSDEPVVNESVADADNTDAKVLVEEDTEANTEEPVVEEEVVEEEQGIVADANYTNISGKYTSDKGNTINVSIATDYDGIWPDGVIEGNTSAIYFENLYMEPTSVNVYEIEDDWQTKNKTGYVLTGCDGGNTVRLYKEGVLIETFTLVMHFES